VLSKERIHTQQVSSKVRELGMENFACIDHILRYGTYYLTEEEYEKVKIEMLDSYHRWLGGCLLKMKGAKFWTYQRNALKECGYPIRWHKVLSGALNEIWDEIQNPKIALIKVLRVLGIGER
jgi:hypothetical protein